MRIKIVERLLSNPEDGQNWARTGGTRFCTDARNSALSVAPVVESYLTEEFNKGTSWDALAKSFITATGLIREHGETAVIMAQGGETAETASEIAQDFPGDPDPMRQLPRPSHRPLEA